jgi:hypothetical protein
MLDNSVMLTTNKLTKILSGVAVLGIATAIAAPAQAASINPFDLFEGAASQFVTNGSLLGSFDSLSFDFLDETGSTGSPDGTLIVELGSTGFFDTYQTGSAVDCDQTNPNCFILDTTGASILAGLPSFLGYNGALADQWVLDLGDVTIAGDVNNGSTREIDLDFTGTFRNLTTSQSIGAEGDLTFEFFLTGPNAGSGNFQIEAQATGVPEPGTILGLLAVGGLGMVSRFKKQK